MSLIYCVYVQTTGAALQRQLLKRQPGGVTSGIPALSLSPTDTTARLQKETSRRKGYVSIKIPGAILLTFRKHSFIALNSFSHEPFSRPFSVVDCMMAHRA